MVSARWNIKYQIAIKRDIKGWYDMRGIASEIERIEMKFVQFVVKYIEEKAIRENDKIINER